MLLRFRFDEEIEAPLMVIRPGIRARHRVDRRRVHRRNHLRTFSVVFSLLAGLLLVVPAAASGSAPPAPGVTGAALSRAGCPGGLSGAAIPTMSSGQAAVRTTIGIAKSMGVPLKGQIIAVM